MSYILDALRTLEQDKEKAISGVDPVQAVLDPDPVPAGKSFQVNLLWVFLTGFLLLALVIGGTFYVARHVFSGPAEQTRQVAAPETSPLPRDVVSVVPPVSPPSARTAVQVTPRHLAPKPARGVERSLPPERPIRPPVSPQPVPRLAPKPAATAAPVPVSPPKRPQVRREVPVFSSPPVREEPVREERVRQSDQASALAEIFYSRMEDDVKLSAIVWSPDPEGRFAIVNLKTVHEGDRVAGYIVREIREDGIIFEKGGEKYRTFLGKH